MVTWVMVTRVLVMVGLVALVTRTHGGEPGDGSGGMVI
jgi:hypothetical protein